MELNALIETYILTVEVQKEILLICCLKNWITWVSQKLVLVYVFEWFLKFEITWSLKVELVTYSSQYDESSDIEEVFRKRCYIASTQSEPNLNPSKVKSPAYDFWKIYSNIWTDLQYLYIAEFSNDFKLTRIERFIFPLF